jgi:hypothetical protein
MMSRLFDKLGWVMAGVVSIVALAAVAGLATAGPLDPSAPPGSTGKTVITALPYTISQPGSYVLNGNLACNGCGSQDSITVAAANVTIDLQGFELSSGNSSGFVISGLPVNPKNVTVLNGTINAGGTGQALRLAESATVDGVTVMGSAGGLGGISVGPNSHVSNCRVEGYTNVATGIEVGNNSVVSNCISSGNQTGINGGSGVSILNTTVNNSTGGEIRTGDRATLDNCSVDGNGTAGNGLELGHDSVVRGCTVTNNGGTEISVGLNSVLENCVAHGKGTAGHGIVAQSDSIVRGCVARNNGGDEITVGNQVVLEDCVAEGWTGTANGPGNGIVIGFKSTVRNCTATNNAGAGILSTGYGVTLASCVATDNGGNGVSLGDSSIVSGCTARNNGSSANDYEIGVGNDGLIENCVANGFNGTGQGQGSGIIVQNKTVVRNCLSSLNLGAGIHVAGTGNRIEGNHLTNSQFGLNVVQDRNLIALNSAWFNNQADYNVPAGNQYEAPGPVSGDTNPWANAIQ